jgi:hypothetical protein
VENIKESRYSMEYARAYAEAAKSAYTTALDDQVRLETVSGNALIGVGTAIAGLAAFKAHADAITAAALAGGAGYAFASWNISKQRQLIYLQARSAIECAEGVLSPFDLDEHRLKEIDHLVDQLERRTSAFINARENLRASNFALVVTPGTEAMHRAADAALQASDEILSAAHNAAAAGRETQGKTKDAAARLVMAVNDVRTSADRQILATIPKLSDVGATISGFKDYADLLAPGAGVGQKLTKAYQRIASAGEQAAAAVPASSNAAARQQKARKRPAFSQGNDPAYALLAAMKDLAVKAEDLVRYTLRVRASLPTVETTTLKSDLAACRLGDVPAPTPSPAASETPPASSTPPGAPAGQGQTSPPTAAGTAPKSTADPLQALAAKVAEVDEFAVAGTNVIPDATKITVTSGKVQVGMTCISTPKTALKANDVVAALLDQKADDGTTIRAEAGEAGGDPAGKITVVGAPECITAGATAQRAKKKPETSTTPR